MLLSDELDKFDKHADVALRRVVRAWGADLSEDGEQLSADQLKVEMSGVGEGALQTPPSSDTVPYRSTSLTWSPVRRSGPNVCLPAVHLAGGPLPSQGRSPRALHKHPFGERALAREASSPAALMCVCFGGLGRLSVTLTTRSRMFWRNLGKSATPSMP